MVVKIKDYFEKTRQVKNNANLKNISYEDNEIQDIMKKYYRIKRNLIIYHNFVI